MKKTIPTNHDIRSFIFYGLSENNINVKSIDPTKIVAIIETYLFYCNEFKTKYVQGELDTFKKAACLLVAINRSSLCSDKKVNASIAVDASQKMCEKPYWNVGPNADIPYKMEEVDFKSVFESDMYCYDKCRSLLTDALIHESGVSPTSVYINLELFYRAAIELKKTQLKTPVDNINPAREEGNSEHTNNTTTPKQKRKNRFFSLLRR